jgi:uncharacterized protein with HEPN domain
MLSDTDEAALIDMRDNILLAQEFIRFFDVDRFKNDIKTVYAATRCLEIISEASRRLSPELKLRHPQIPWKAIAGAGSIYRHDYENVLAGRVFDTIQEALPALFDAILIELYE